MNEDKSVYLLDYGFAEQSTKKLDRYDDYRLFKNDVINDDVKYLKQKYKQLSKIIEDYKDYVNKMLIKYTKKI